MSVVPPNPFQHYSQNAGSSTPYNHPDPLPAPCARLNTPFRQPQRTPISDDPRNIQYSSFPPPPALIQSTFGSNIGAQFPGATACLVHTPMNTPGNTPGQAIPELPTDMPSLQQWSFPAGVLAWSPHPARECSSFFSLLEVTELFWLAHPNVPASAFWSDANTLQGMPQTQHHYTPKTLRSSQITQITGGHPLPGQDVTWTPGTWPPTPWDMTPVPIRLSPCIIPNPGNPDLPQIVWDITQNPIRAQRITGAHTIIPLASRMGEQAVVPAVQEIHIATQNPIVQQMWGNISLQTVSAATIWDLLHAIYEYFQTPLTYAEVGYLQSLDPNNYDVLVAAWRARCNVTPSLPGFEAAQGLKRADLLGDQRAFWGMWVSIDDAQNSWYLNLGLVNLQSGT